MRTSKYKKLNVADRSCSYANKNTTNQLRGQRPMSKYTGSIINSSINGRTQEYKSKQEDDKEKLSLLSQNLSPNRIVQHYENIVKLLKNTSESIKGYKKQSNQPKENFN